MFWRYNNNSSSETDAVLANEAATLFEVMDADDIISQCKVQNKALIDFLLRPNMMEELVTLITNEPAKELEERIRFKYPNIACELLTSDIPAINECLAGDEMLLEKFYGFLDCDPPLNPLLASYFSRIMGALIAKKTEQNWLSYQFTCLQVLDFLKAKDNFISLLLKHLGTSAIMDLMLKLMTQVESVEMKQNILNWLDSQRIMQLLVSLLNAKVDSERHYNVAQLLCDFIRVARDTQRNATERVDPDPLLNTIESPETISMLLGNIFEGEVCESAIIGGIQVLLALLDYNVLSYNPNINDEAIDIEHRDRVVQSITESIEKHLEHFNDLLLNPPKKAGILTTIGTLEPPLGNTRLHIVKLFAAAISTNNATLSTELVRLNTFSVLLELFFKYPWNNFLHTQVENCLIFALKAHSAFDDDKDDTKYALCRHLLVNCNLIERIIKAWKDNDEKENETNGMRQGYMGHLISLMNRIVDLCTSSTLGQYMLENTPETANTLQEFKEGTLKETNAIQDTLLGGAYPNASNEESEEYGDIAFPQDQVISQMYSNYQMQHLTSHHVDGYSGFNDDAFNDGDDTLQSIDQKTGMNFNLAEDENNTQQQHDFFKQMCAQTINTLDDGDDEIFEEREHTFNTVIEKEEDEQIESPVHSSDSDDEAMVPADSSMVAVDQWLSSKSLETDDGNSADPWSCANATDTAGDWADFSSVNFEANFDQVFTNKSNEQLESISQGSHIQTTEVPVENAEKCVDEVKEVAEENIGEAKEGKESEKLVETEEKSQEKRDNVEGEPKQPEPPGEPAKALSIIEDKSVETSQQDKALEQKHV